MRLAVSILVVLAVIATADLASAQSTNQEVGSTLNLEASGPAGATTFSYRRRPGMWITGISVFGATYGWPLLLTIAMAEGYEGFYALPVFGPIIAGAIGRARGDYDVEEVRWAAVLSLVQAAGLTLFSIGFRKRRVENHNLAVFPSVTRDRIGLEVVLF